jgi:hypothetical protein
VCSSIADDLVGVPSHANLVAQVSGLEEANSRSHAQCVYACLVAGDG